MSTLDLAKEHLLDLSKKVELSVEKAGLGTQQARVATAFDVSGSMGNLYRSGTVQEAADRLLALGIKFDSNKAIDTFAFDNNGYNIGEINEDNFFGFVNKNIAPKVGGGTSYAPVMKQILGHYGYAIGGESTVTKTETVAKKSFFGKVFGGTEEVTSSQTVSTPGSVPTNLDDPVFVIFMTDGDNFDHAETEKVIRESSKYGVFWKFVGIGSASFSFLQKLDDLSGRFIDNADFIKVPDIATVSETELYDRLLQEFSGWLSEAKRNNLIKQ
jgi:hypothetical protein